MSGFVGTISYMSSGQLTTHDLSSRTDIFALGVVLYEMLTGRHDFLAITLDQTVLNILTGTPTFGMVETNLFPLSLKLIRLECLAKDPKNRPNAIDIVRITSARQSYESLAPHIPEINSIRLMNKASTLAAIGRLDEAQSILESYLELQPYNLSAIINLAEVYFLSNNVHKSTKYVEQALSSVQWLPADRESIVTLLTNLANYYLSIEPEKAIYYARHAIELDPYD